MKIKILILAIYSLLLTVQLYAQDTSSRNDKNFKAKIEDVVEKVFRQVEEELGIKIYDEDELTESNTNVNDQYLTKRSRYEDYSPYAFLVYKRIPRNNSTVFVPENYHDRFLFRYNRVEGLFLGFQSPHKYFWDSERKVTLFGSIGYAFSAHRWEFDIGISHQLNFNSNLFEVGIEGHNSVSSRDHWLISNLENSISAMFFKFDYKDYFLRKGFSSWISFNKESDIADLQARISYLNDIFSSLQKNVNWSLFRSKKNFRDNPDISEGNVKGISFTLSLHRLDDIESNSSGWSFSVTTEFAGKLFKGDYNFNRYLIDLRRYQQISRYDDINIRLRFATSEGQLPLQHLYEIGGISTLPAYSYKEFIGNRLLLSNIEYIINGGVVTEESSFPFSLVNKFNLILFYDIGYINRVTDNESFGKGFHSLKISSMISDWGFGIGTSDGRIRLAFAWKTDRKSSPNIFIRMSRPF